MDADVLRSLVEEGLSTRGIAARLESNQSTVRRGLKKAGLVTKPKRKLDGLPDACLLCNRPPKQYDHRRRSLCGSCATRVRRYRTKEAAVRLLGGKCKRCGWSGPLGAFDFHHVKGKDFTIGNVANRSWAMVKKELAKCELLCRNCHSLEHCADRGDAFMAEVRNYNGQLLI